jgi:membrane-bound lytic murein transglycosylase MltF
MSERKKVSLTQVVILLGILKGTLLETLRSKLWERWHYKIAVTLHYASSNNDICWVNENSDHSKMDAFLKSVKQECCKYVHSRDPGSFLTLGLSSNEHCEALTAVMLRL